MDRTTSVSVRRAGPKRTVRQGSTQRLAAYAAQVAARATLRQGSTQTLAVYAAKVAARAGALARSRPFWTGASRFRREIGRMRRLGLSVSEASFALIMLVRGASYEEAVNSGQFPPEVA